MTGYVALGGRITKAPLWMTPPAPLTAADVARLTALAIWGDTAAEQWDRCWVLAQGAS